MATEAKRIYLDTNILAYVANLKAPQHQAALEIFRPTDREILLGVLKLRRSIRAS
ncbi:hypothetical protein [Roseofilum capinflatum]|uniref:PIN domain-containing protein n=1 Tax=Roseofilum capinflatum BLCC-M114 TaxID=3022440 RepID=A0ABT7B0D6_9CYAN|nr:hypothetical protein [Roseofilum capinflatum]MDJ1172634.1 hypothetical protein [Roseofilum capinflatum BLCC-M114]